MRFCKRAQYCLFVELCPTKARQKLATGIKMHPNVSTVSAKNVKQNYSEMSSPAKKNTQSSEGEGAGGWGPPASGGSRRRTASAAG